MTLQRLRNRTATWGAPLLGIGLIACGPDGIDYPAEWEGWEHEGASGGEERGDVSLEEIPELSQPVTGFAGSCTYVASTQVLTFTAAAGDVTTIVTLRSYDSAILVNGKDTLGVSGTTCNASGAAVAKNSIKKLVIDGTSASSDTVILDYINGTFGMAGGGDGTVITGLTNLKIRGTKSADTIFVGLNGIGIDNNSSVDIKNGDAGNDPTDWTSLVFSLVDGSDRFDARGSGSGTGGAYSGTGLTVYGGPGSDFIYGGTGADTLHGGEDNDTIYGEGGNDTLYGDEGNDIFDEGSAANGADTFHGGDGTDEVRYTLRTTAITGDLGNAVDGESGENDKISSGSTVADGTSVEVIRGGKGNDTLTGTSAAESLYGEDGNDTIDGGDGNDNLYGGNGNDTFNMGSAADGDDFISGGAGTDTVNYSLRSADLSITQNNTADDGDAAATEKDNVQADVEAIYGGSADDEITGGSADNIIRGGAGDDILNGGSGDDTFEQGVATADTGTDEDTINGGAGNDTVSYALSTSSVYIFLDGTTKSGCTACGNNPDGDILTSIEDAIGGTKGDIIVGNSSNNFLDGLGGADIIFGMGGDDYIDGSGAAGARDAVACGSGQGDMVVNALGGLDVVREGSSDSDSTATVLKDAAGAWADDDHNDRVVVITGGTNAGDVRRISDSAAAAGGNSATITVATAFTAAPDTTTKYVIVKTDFTAVSDADSAVGAINDDAHSQTGATGKLAWMFLGAGKNQGAKITAQDGDSFTIETVATAPATTDYALVPALTAANSGCELH